MDCDAVGREEARPFGCQPEQVDHVQFRYRIRLGIDRRAVHLLMSDTGLIVRHGIPLIPGGGIGVKHLLVGVELLLVRLEELAVDLPRLLRGYVSSGESPVLVQHLPLESTEYRFDALRRGVVWGRRAIYPADVGEEALRNLTALAALIVGNDLIGFVAGGFDRHAEGAELRIEVLRVAHCVAEQRLAVGVDHLIDRCRAHHAAAVPFRPVGNVQFRAVAVPQRVSQGRHHGLVAASEELLGCQLTIDRIVPLRLDLRSFEVLYE